MEKMVTANHPDGSPTMIGRLYPKTDGGYGAVVIDGWIIVVEEEVGYRVVATGGRERGVAPMRVA